MIPTSWNLSKTSEDAFGKSVQRRGGVGVQEDEEEDPEESLERDRCRCRLICWEPQESLSIPTQCWKGGGGGGGDGGGGEGGGGGGVSATFLSDVYNATTNDGISYSIFLVLFSLIDYSISFLCLSLPPLPPSLPPCPSLLYHFLDDVTAFQVL